MERCYPYSALRPLASLRTAIKAVAPDLVIACDDTTALQLDRLHAQACAAAPLGNELRAVVERSLGAPAACSLATARSKFLSLAAAEGVRVPATSVINGPRELDDWCARRGLPGVLKLDCTWGGQGVAIVRNREDAQAAYRLLASRPSVTSVLARALLERDPSFVMDWLRNAHRVVTVQDFIPGLPANRAVACWQGQVLAGISVLAMRTQHPTGPATVVRVIENVEMSEAVARVVRRLGITGLWGMDFILAASTGAAYAVEMNPRATPISHLPLGLSRNLVLALYARLTGHAPASAPATIDRDVIALFPGEWRRDGASPYLRNGHHDVPWEELGLVLDCIDRPWADRGALARLRASLRPNRSRPNRSHSNRPPPASKVVDCVDTHCGPTARATKRMRGEREGEITQIRSRQPNASS